MPICGLNSWSISPPPKTAVGRPPVSTKNETQGQHGGAFPTCEKKHNAVLVKIEWCEYGNHCNYRTRRSKCIGHSISENCIDDSGSITLRSGFTIDSPPLLSIFTLHLYYIFVHLYPTFTTSLLHLFTSFIFTSSSFIYLLKCQLSKSRTRSSN